MENPFIIKFSGLKPGLHELHFTVDDSFFADISHSPIQQGQLKAVVDFEKRTDMLVLDIDFEGTVRVPCDRCTELFDQFVTGTEQILVKFTDVPMEEEPELLYIPKGSTEFDCSHLLYELILLNLPMQMVHPEVEGQPQCPEEVLRLFTRAPEEPDEDPDSVWDALKEIN